MDYHSSVTSDPFAQFESRHILVRADLRSLGIDVSDTTLLRWEFGGRFPRRIKLGGTRVAWLAHEVLQWINDVSAKRATTHYADPF
jgi:predicted DNA-binding transcriptional regulator AlpA